MTVLVVTGTSTGVGKTVATAALAATATAAEIAAKAVLIAAFEPPISDLFGASVVALTAADGRVDLLQRTTGNSNDFARLAAAGRAA